MCVCLFQLLSPAPMTLQILQVSGSDLFANNMLQDPLGLKAGQLCENPRTRSRGEGDGTRNEVTVNNGV